MIGILLLLPVLGAICLYLLRKKFAFSLPVSVLISVLHLLCAVSIVSGRLSAQLNLSVMGFEFAFRTDAVSGLYLLLGAAVFPFLSLFSVRYCKGKEWGGKYLFCLYISLAMLDGAILADHLGLLLFFWEGLLCTLFGMLLLRNSEKPQAAIKALSLSGIADLLMMLGIIITVHIAGTGRISELHGLPTEGLGMAGCLCLLAGALGKAGCMPFHSWIPAAAADAPTPFLVAFPGALEKMAGVYLATRIITGIYDFQPGSTVSLIVMIVGSVTLFCGVAMALVQKDMKRLLAYHAISQVGYIVVGLGSGLAVGLSGAVFHLVNNVFYKAGLFMIAGAVEMQTGTTDLHQFSGLRKKMPLTAVCMVIFALSIAGFPGTNGFYSKELIFDAALETHVVFYLIALFGAFMTAASFLKMTRSAFWGSFTVPQGMENVEETPFACLLPIGVLAIACLFCGICNRLPIDRWIGVSYGLTERFGGFPSSWILVLLSCLILSLAVADHVYGSKKTGSALSAADHLHDLPVIKQIYAAAFVGAFDPYNWLTKLVDVFARLCAFIESGVTWLYDSGIPKLIQELGGELSQYDNGSLSRYLMLAIVGMLLVGMIFLVVLL